MAVKSGIRFFFNRLRERLWIKPLLFSLISVAAAFTAKAADSYPLLPSWLPSINPEMLETLLSIMASSMLVIATLAVTSMVSAYASASNTASPRAFALVVADDVSQRALSIYIGAFIFSIVSLIAFKNGFYGHSGRFMLFAFTLAMFAIVILMFVRWVDRIARLGRMGNTLEKVEEATAKAFLERKRQPAFQGVAISKATLKEQGHDWLAIHPDALGYVQRINIAALNSCAEHLGCRVRIALLPGTFVTQERVLAYARCEEKAECETDQLPTQLADAVRDAFLIGQERLFDDDPRYGLIILSQIASRALSPAVNDPGTAIDIISILVRLFTLWQDTEAQEPVDSSDKSTPRYPRVEVPELSLHDMLEDAFTALGRDGSHSVEVASRLQRALASLQLNGDAEMRAAARAQSTRALFFAEQALTYEADLNTVRQASATER